MSQLTEYRSNIHDARSSLVS